MLGAMVAGTALVMLVGARHAPVAKMPSPPARVAEAEPWLTAEAAAQIVGEHGKLGPLFAGLELGGPAPSADVRERIEKFARANHVELELEIVDAQLTSVRFAVTYAGCCGYEPADVLALRLDRPSTGHCCVCGDDTWINDWALANEDLYMRASVRVNRVEVRWAPRLKLPELLARANALIGMDASSVRAAAGERWQVRYVSSGLYGVPDVAATFFAVPYASARYPLDYPIYLGYLGWPDEGWARVTIEDGRIAEVSLVVRDLGEEGESRADALKALRSTWGRPSVRRRNLWTWRANDRSVTAEIGTYEPHVTVRKG